MTPETAEHLDRAREYLIKARRLLDVMRYNDEAGRAAYLAGFHAAQALISERTGKIAKTHEGVHSQFNLLTKGDQGVDAELRRFLSPAYDLNPSPTTKPAWDRSCRSNGWKRRSSRRCDLWSA